MGPDFEGLSNGLNVMLARLLGREEPNEDESEEEQDESSRWRSDQMLVDEGDRPAAEPPATRACSARRARPIYYARLFNEYVAALRSQGKPTEGITVQAFTAKLRLIEGGPEAEVEVPHGALQGQRAASRREADRRWRSRAAKIGY